MVRKILLALLIILPIFLFVSTQNSAFADPSTPSTTTGTIPIGSFGCAVSLDGKTQIIGCASGAICVPIQPNSTVDLGKGEIDNGFCLAVPTKCPACDPGYDFIPYNAQCEKYNNIDGTYTTVDATIQKCNPGETCSPGYGGCQVPNNTTQTLSTCPNGTCDTALGPLPTDLPGLLTKLFSIVLSIAGVVALGLIIASGYRLMISQGNPEQVKGAREQLTAAIVGLLFIVFSLVILQVISANILKIPGFG